MGTAKKKKKILNGHKFQVYSFDSKNELAFEGKDDFKKAAMGQSTNGCIF